MSRSSRACAGLRWPVWAVRMAVVMGCTLAFGGASGQSVTRIEEDWELVVAEPDRDSSAPQVVCVVAPTGDLESLYAAFELNHQSEPDFESGGLTLHLHCGDTPLGAWRAHDSQTLHHDAETVTWTQRMQLSDGKLHFEVVDGHSHSWGNFGSNTELHAEIDTSLSSLSTYSPAHSIAHSGVSFASNRVTSLTLKSVRWYTDSGLLTQFDFNRVVYPADDEGQEGDD